MKLAGLVLTTVFVMSGGSLFAAPGQGKSNGRGNSNAQPVRSEGHDKDAGLHFGSVEIRIIRDWFSSPSNLRGLPPGLAKKESLPPGLQKHLRRNGSLPPGLQKKIQPLPRDLDVRLPRLPDGRRRVVISGSVVLLDERRNMILDVVADVF